MSKVYVLTAVYYENENIVGVFSSYTAMLTYLKEKYDYESEISYTCGKDFGVFEKLTSLYCGGIEWELSYNVYDLIGETSHKTDKLVIKEGN